MKILSNILYNIISILDYIDFNYIKKRKLTDNYKTIEEIELPDGIQVLTDTGFKPVTHLMLTKPFEQYTIVTENGYELVCADEHIVFDSNYNEIYVENLKVGDYIQTDQGAKQVVSISYNPQKVCMTDISVNDDNHRFYSNGILSHNSVTTAIYCVWMAIFHSDKNCLVLSKSGPAGVDLIKKIQDIYRYLPYYLKPGIMKFNQGAIAFDNNSQIATEPFSPTAGLGKTINFLILDEFAWCPPNDVELFYNNIIPTVTTISNSNVCIMSTQNGFNFFHQLWSGAEQHKNVYAPFKVDWWQVPQYNPDTKCWEKRDEAWKEMMVGVLGSEQAFYYQYGTTFSASDKCLVTRECLSRLRDNTYLFSIIEKCNPDYPYFSMGKQFLYLDPNFNINLFKQEFFIILVDLAEGGGNDYTVFNILQVTGKDKFKQVGYWRSNSTDIEQASLEFWVLYPQLFNPERCIVSIEWNTYGALFYNYISQFNEPEYRPEWSWRYMVNRSGELDLSCIIFYKKGDQEEEIAGINGQKFKKAVPGIKFTGANKKSACALLKMMIEKEQIDIHDLVTISELENFEDKNGNGSYAASYGHDDIIMTFCQIPLLINTAKYKEFIEEYVALHLVNQALQMQQGYDQNTMSMQFPQMYQGIPNQFNMMGVPDQFNNFNNNDFMQPNFNTW